MSDCMLLLFLDFCNESQSVEVAGVSANTAVVIVHCIAAAAAVAVAVISDVCCCDVNLEAVVASVAALQLSMFR